MQSQEQAADSRVERLAGRAEGRRVAAETEGEGGGGRSADPRHVAARLGSAAAAARQPRAGR